MKTVELQKVTTIIAGQSPDSSTYNSIAEGLPFFQGKADFQEKFPKVRIWCNSAKRKEAEPGDILMSVRAPVGSVNICNRKCIIGRGLSAIRPHANLNNYFLYYYLKCNEKNIASLGTGSTFQAITQTTLKRIEIPLPPLDDQIRIATLLSKVENLISRRREQLKQLDELLKSVFLEMFGDPVRNEKGWEVRALSAIFSVKHGYAFKSDFFVDSGNFVLLTPGNFFEKGGFRDRGERQKYFNGEFPKEYILNKNDLLLAMTEQAPGLLGSPLLVPETGSYLHNQRLGLICGKEEIQMKYLFHFFNQQSIRQIIHSKATGTKVRHTSPTKIVDIIVGYPSIDLQNQFSKIAEKVEGIKSCYQQSLIELENLYGMLSQKAFKGELDISRILLIRGSPNDLNCLSVF